ncbi:Tetratricopeptide repeat domain 26 [Caligus rogercresseyi]|uniref:Tetratricopeptide repeat domain 26 n=1 Tax=Caligus rogercresseyi TaxID=217165 RepID=A0A7T8GVE7_CALRO|nr:Tetratricopeptide repeat domain 26 [Caligus rogercresseyi]
MILSRAKPAVSATESSSGGSAQKKQIPTLEEFLSARDYTGALSLLEFDRNSGKGGSDIDLWMGYCAFHLGDYKRAMLEYEAITCHDKTGGKNNNIKEAWLNLACVYFYLGMYHESEKAADSSESRSQLRNRLRFHLAHKFSDEKKLMTFHQELEDVVEDQLSLASIHYLRSHYQEAIDIYKRILLALCYYKLDYYDVSQEVLAVYLQHYPDSATAINLKACNHFQELKTLKDQTTNSTFNYGVDLIQHNLVVFRNGEGSLQILPPLVDVVSEARLNLVIYFLRQDDVNEAYSLIKDLEPTVPQEYILKGVVNASIGQENGSREHLKIAQQYFQLVGGSASECDTIPGRQCMAACFFLLKQFVDVLLYLNSIKSYYYNDDTFNFNYAQAKASVGNFKEAEEIFTQIQNEKMTSDYAYLSWLARCYIMNKKPRLAWELYLKMETSGEAFSILQLIANDCYKVRLKTDSYPARATGSNPEYWEGKRGAAVGMFQAIIAGNEEQQLLEEVVQILKTSSGPQVEHILKVMRKWAKENRISL